MTFLNAGVNNAFTAALPIEQGYGIRKSANGKRIPADVTQLTLEIVTSTAIENATSHLRTVLTPQESGNSAKFRCSL